jgi:superfamily II DNA or RNA helicase
MEVLGAFKRPSSDVNAIVLSAVGDVALDMPEANVIIQVRYF